MSTSLEIEVGVPLIQEGREFTTQITGLIEPFAKIHSLDVFETVKTIVASIIGHSPSYLEKFSLWEEEKTVEMISSSSFLIQVEGIWKKAKLKVSELSLNVKI